MFDPSIRNPFHQQIKRHITTIHQITKIQKYRQDCHATNKVTEGGPHQDHLAQNPILDRQMITDVKRYEKDHALGAEQTKSIKEKNPGKIHKEALVSIHFGEEEHQVLLLKLHPTYNLIYVL